jgi:Concanavalin A-like lectin/glucanases superfamily
MLPRNHPFRRAQRRRAATVARSGGFTPPQAGVSAWLRLAASTPVSSEYETVVDVLNSNPAAQTSANRKPAAGTSANGLPTATFDGTDVVPWPMHASNNSTTTWGLALWFNPASVAGSQAILSIRTTPASVNKLMIWLSGSKLAMDAYISGNNGRRIESTTTTLVAGTWHWLRVAYDSSGGGDGCVSLFVDEAAQSVSASNLGAGGTLGALPAPTGTALFGGVTDSDTPSTPVQNGGIYGPNWFVLNATPSAAQVANLRTFEQPT